MLRTILKHRVLTALFVLAFALVAGGGIWAYATLHKIGSGPFILHFNDMEGITSVGAINSILTAGIFGALTVVINFFIALELEKRSRFLGATAGALTLLFAVLLFISFVAILNVN